MDRSSRGGLCEAELLAIEETRETCETRASVKCVYIYIYIYIHTHCIHIQIVIIAIHS